MDRSRKFPEALLKDTNTHNQWLEKKAQIVASGLEGTTPPQNS